MADQQMTNKNVQIALFVMVVILIGVVIWEEARLSKAVELCQAFIESVPDQPKTQGSDPARRHPVACRSAGSA